MHWFQICVSDMDSLGRPERLVFRRQNSPSHLCHKDKGVWSETGDYLGHFMDVKVLNFHIMPVCSNPLPPSHKFPREDTKCVEKRNFLWALCSS